jgi:hypothetical protein
MRCFLSDALLFSPGGGFVEIAGLVDAGWWIGIAVALWIKREVYSKRGKMYEIAQFQGPGQTAAAQLLSAQSSAKALAERCDAGVPDEEAHQEAHCQAAPFAVMPMQA